MKIYLAGATGVIGSRLLALLVERGDEVVAMTRTPSKAARLRELGAEPVVCDVYDREALTAAVLAAAPEMVIHQLTDLPDRLDQLPETAGANARMRREGTANLLSAARAAGATRLLAQSIAWEPAGDGAAAKHELEAAVLGFGGTVVRYGQLHGPGTYYPDTLPPQPRVQIDRAVARTLELLEFGAEIVTVVDESDVS